MKSPANSTPRPFPTFDEKRISAAARYIAQFERSFARAHKALKAEQTDLALRAIPQNEPIAGLPAACQIKMIGNEASKIARRDPDAGLTILEAIARAFSPLQTPKLYNSNIPSLTTKPPDLSRYNRRLVTGTRNPRARPLR